MGPASNTATQHVISAPAAVKKLAEVSFFTIMFFFFVYKVGACKYYSAYSLGPLTHVRAGSLKIRLKFKYPTCRYMFPHIFVHSFIPCNGFTSSLCTRSHSHVSVAQTLSSPMNVSA